jgi:hypothetical protein
MENRGGAMRVLRASLLCAAGMLVAGCEQMITRPPPEKMHECFTQLNAKFEQAYEGILAKRGTRSFPIAPPVAFDTLLATLTRLGMIVEARDRYTGTLTVASPAPKPLSETEWQEVLQTDTPMMASVLCPCLGAYCTTLKFRPEDYVIVINATVLPGSRGGSQVSLTTRMREIAPPPPGVPRRDYPPPTGVSMALDKIWGEFDQELAAENAPARRRTR